MAGGAAVAGALLAERVSLRRTAPCWAPGAILARDLIVRTLAFQVCYVSAAAVARVRRCRAPRPWVMLQLWDLLALVLDSLACGAVAGHAPRWVPVMPGTLRRYGG